MVKHYHTPAALVAIGLQLVPIPNGFKYPRGYEKWQITDFSYLANNWPKNCGIGIKCGEVLGLDVDIYHEDVVDEIWQHIKNNYPEAVGRIGQAPKILIPFVCDEITEKIVSNKWRPHDGKVNAIEILTAGQQFVAFGIHPDTKKPYTWTGDFLEHAMPQITLEEIHTLFNMFDEIAANKGWQNISEKEQKKQTEYKPRQTTGDSPGDLYNRSCRITDCLQEYGWKHLYGKYWQRPGKKGLGNSATVFEDNTVYIHTTSTSLEPERKYDCFGLLAHYEYGGDFKRAAKAILKEIKEAA